MGVTHSLAKYTTKIWRGYRGREDGEKIISNNTEMPQKTLNHISRNSFNKREYRCPQGGEEGVFQRKIQTK